jgi:hypothetical protein
MFIDHYGRRARRQRGLIYEEAAPNVRGLPAQPA